MRASGTFDVKMMPYPPGPQSDDAGASPPALSQMSMDQMSMSRMSIDKQYHGDLLASGKGQMLAVRTPVDGSAGYVAMELVSGSLHGRSGAFALQHSGSMTRGAPQLSISVVPDSGSGELLGLAGTLTISLADGKHAYELEYTLPGAD